MRDESLSTERGRGNEEGRDMQRGRRSRIRQEFGDNISGLQLDPEPPRLPPLGETGRIMMTEIQPIGEVEAELEGERHGGIRRFRMRVRDYCTPGERRVVEEWIVGCGRARGKGFVKPAKEGRGVDERSEGEDEGEVEGVVRVRGGGRGWPEWGIGWGAYKFLS